MTRSRSLSTMLPAALIALGIALAVGFTLAFPEVEGLGAKVRLPVFHGALTWVNLAGFCVMALLALVYVFTGRDKVYAWVEAMRFVLIPLWVTGAVLGLLAALNTWDFTGSKASPLTVAAADPRLVAQFWITLLGLAVMALSLLIEDRRWLAIADAGFVAALWTIIMRAVLGPGRALHPDSPVMNSDEIGIKLLFFGIVLGLAVATTGLVMGVRALRAGRPAAGEGTAGESTAAQ